MPFFSVHPTTRLCLWLLLLIVVQCLSGGVLVAAFFLLPFFGLRVLKRGGRLVWRARWLLISLFAILSWGTAGEPLWQGFSAPTQEGLADASLHLGRLLLVLMGVAAFLENMPLPDLLAATHFLFRRLPRAGFDPDRGVVRLMLALRYVETLPRPRDWRGLLNAPVSTDSERVLVSHPPVRTLDYVLALVAVTGAIWVCFFKALG